MTDERGADPRRTPDSVEEMDDANPMGEPIANPAPGGGAVEPADPARRGEEVDLEEASPVLPDDDDGEDDA